MFGGLLSMPIASGVSPPAVFRRPVGAFTLPVVPGVSPPAVLCRPVGAFPCVVCMQDARILHYSTLSYSTFASWGVKGVKGS